MKTQPENRDLALRADEPVRLQGRKAFVTPTIEPRGALAIHFCSGINLWDGTGGTIQCN